MSRSIQQGRKTRERLMDAAAVLIAEHGWGAVTTEMVAERAGLCTALLYYHFPSVTDLLIDASLRLAQYFGTGVLEGALAQPGPTGVKQLLGALTPYSAALPDSRVFSEILLAATRYERLREGLSPMLRGFRAAVATWLHSEGVADPEATATVLLATLDGLILDQVIDPTLSTQGFDEPLRRLTGIPQIGARARQTATSS
ncbi:TetR/AcrR family transcriptional regulator [Nocardia sp. CA2R105]|uniref:TetR/AcrR family transcriptional regulator n=1 Tax=Nocardia coffeae TaxID=2873381 RepID=UPI001CA6FC8D|nr:TetR/AcrR family transcriptional regulator [Nocardia coffeae]MBY8855440.1 TetR/AcrR family transcriptional regulator [Nocardia coffeae]